MAKAELVRPVVEPDVNLVLTMEEAKVLRKVCANIAGHNTRTDRKHMDAIADALYRIGITSCNSRSKGFIEFLES